MTGFGAIRVHWGSWRWLMDTNGGFGGVLCPLFRGEHGIRVHWGHGLSVRDRNYVSFIPSAMVRGFNYSFDVHFYPHLFSCLVSSFLFWLLLFCTQLRILRIFLSVQGESLIPYLSRISCLSFFLLITLSNLESWLL